MNSPSLATSTRGDLHTILSARVFAIGAGSVRTRHPLQLLEHSITPSPATAALVLTSDEDR